MLSPPLPPSPPVGAGAAAEEDSAGVGSDGVADGIAGAAVVLEPESEPLKHQYWKPQRLLQRSRLGRSLGAALARANRVAKVVKVAVDFMVDA